ncbi:MAG: carbohydrate ABC transporter permease [Chloroflexota bacterium]|nr:carbohydrate ABC transporter permease [Chloroflexota bacterium]
MRRERRIRLILSYAILIGWTLVLFFPLYWLVATAFKTGVAVSTGPTYLPFVDFQPGLHAFEEVFVENREMAMKPFMNSTITALSSSAVALFIGSMAGYALARFRFGGPGSNGIAFAFLAQRMFPTAVLVIPFLIMYRELELLDTRLGLSIAYTGFSVPFVVWVMRDFFLGLPVEVEESALIDGCSRLGVLTRIVLPLAAPGLVAVFILIMIGAWNEYLFALVLTFSEAVTVPLFLQIQTQAVLGTAWWNLAAISLVSVIPVVVAGLALERYITRGLTFGAVK